MSGRFEAVNQTGCSSAGRSRTTSKQGAIHERHYDGRLTCGQLPHRAEADITKSRGRSGFGELEQFYSIDTRTRQGINFAFTTRSGIDVTNKRVNRRLMAILAADVAGYSRLVGADEEGTLALWKAHLSELIEPKIAEHQGRIVRITGDGLLVEFVSVIAAVKCAVEVQHGMAERNIPVQQEKRIEFRMGINVGDIIIDGSDMWGDGVNVAARLEALAEPGGICISGRVQEDVQGKLDISFEDMGEQLLKNIARPVRLYRVRAEESAKTRPALPLPHETSPARTKPSIAVLPFANMSVDPGQDYFADGMVDEIITSLSRLRWLYVTARTSSFEFKGRNQDIRDIARRLNVGYVLEGSVRKAGDHLRIIGQLIDAETGTHIWADRFDGRLDDLFDLQDKLTENVVAAIEPNVLSAEIARAKSKRPESLNAYEHYLKALPFVYELSSDSSVEALRLLYKAIELDLTYAPAYAIAAHMHMYLVVGGKIDEAAGGVRMARAALAADPDDPRVLSEAPFVVATLGRDLDTGLAAIERGVRLYPNVPEIVSQSGYVFTLVGDQDAALERFKAALRLNPRNPRAYRNPHRSLHRMHAYGAVRRGRHLRGGSSSTTRKVECYFPTSHSGLCASRGSGEAAAALSDIANWLRARRSLALRSQLPYRNLDQAERLWSGLRKAGLPE